MKDVIEANRLKLRRVQPADAPLMAELIADWDVIKWLTAPPYPYVLSDAEWYIEHGTESDSYAIEIDGAYAGQVGLTEGLSLGYWLGKSHHGKGYMTEAVLAVLADHFANSDEPLTSGYLLGNEASDNVLTKVGFKNTAIKAERSVPLNKRVQVQKMELTKDRWGQLHG